MRYLHIVHHGVIGPCRQLQMDADHSLVVDCGLFQGNEPSADGCGRAGQHNVEATIKAHVHIDHVGRIPHLLAAGYNGPICCAPSAKLLPIVLEDAFKLGFSRDSKEIARYHKLAEQRLHPLPYNQWFVLLKTSQLCVHIRLQRAGHVLGSAYVEIGLTYPATGMNKRVVFSGILCAPHAPLLKPPKSQRAEDIPMLESIYGDRLHEDRASHRQWLDAVIEHAPQDNGTVLIPAFSIGRTRELLDELEENIHSKTQVSANPPSHALNERRTDGRTDPRTPHAQRPLSSGTKRASGISRSTAVQLETSWPKLPVIFDSPLATHFTAAYRSLKPYWNQQASQRVEAGGDHLAFENLIMIDSDADHIAVLNHPVQTARPAIVISCNGMCAGGRIVNYLKAVLQGTGTICSFVGYQAKRTSGYAIRQFGPKGGYVDGKRFDIRLKVTSIGGYSAHADQKELVEFVAGMPEWPDEIRVAQGELSAKGVLVAQLHTSYQQQGRSDERITFGKENRWHTRVEGSVRPA